MLRLSAPETPCSRAARAPPRDVPRTMRGRLEHAAPTPTASRRAGPTGPRTTRRARSEEGEHSRPRPSRRRSGPRTAGLLLDAGVALVLQRLRELLATRA